MQSFPMFLRTTGRRVVIAGGGEQAAQKTRLMLKTDAILVLAAPVLDDELAALARSGRISHEAGRVTAATFADTVLVFIGTGCPGADRALHAIAKAAGATVNVVDQPALCDATTPSIVDRDPVVVAIGTEGTAPVLARKIKTEVEQLLDPRLGGFAALAGRLRDAVATRLPHSQRRAFWRWAFSETPWTRHQSGAEREAADLLKSVIASGIVPGADRAGRISLVSAGPGLRDLLTLRAVNRLQEADVIYHDALGDPLLLDLARRDAERVFVGQIAGTANWPLGRLNAVILRAAQDGKRVVRILSGDGQQAEAEFAAAAATAGITVETVPGMAPGPALVDQPDPLHRAPLAGRVHSA